jgi:hypothetical protein
VVLTGEEGWPRNTCQIRGDRWHDLP